MNKKIFTDKYILFAVILLMFGAGIRAIDLNRAVDGSVRESWRECDMASIARNYYQEDMNLFYPRVDWRGDGPGYAEMEFPILSWSMAVLYRMFGFNEVYGRILLYVLSILTMLAFFALSRHLLTGAAGLGACLFFVLSPLAVRIANTLQPEGFMFLFYILGVYGFIRWIESDSWKMYLAALSFTMLAILVKMSAAHIGILYALLLLDLKGVRELRRLRVLVFALCALIPAGLWYHHAHSLWLEYGNSLGVSNEYHWFGWEFFTDTSFIKGILRSEIMSVWMPAGAIVLAMVVYSRPGSRAVRVSLLWLAAICIYFIAIMRTAGDDWAIYYHVVSVPPVALLIGSAFMLLGEEEKRRQIYLVLMAGTLVLVISILLAVLYLDIHLSFQNEIFLLILFLVVVAVATFRIQSEKWHAGMLEGKRRIFKIISAMIIPMCLAAIFIHQGIEIAGDVHPHNMEALYQCARTFAPHIPENTLILASGGPCTDRDGYPVAYNASYMFYWLDRKGFNICIGEQSVDAVAQYGARGARYFVAEKDAMKEKPGFREQIEKEFPVVQVCEKAVLFDLRN